MVDPEGPMFRCATLVARVTRLFSCTFFWSRSTIGRIERSHAVHEVHLMHEETIPDLTMNWHTRSSREISMVFGICFILFSTCHGVFSVPEG
jgi:hypothetical protein